MATMQIKILPLEIPKTVLVEYPGGGDPIEIDIREVDESSLAELIEDFSNALVSHTSQKG